MKKIMLLLLMCLFLTNCNKTPLEKIDSFLDNVKSSDTLVLYNFTNFNWDYFIIITARDIEKTNSILNQKGISTNNIQNIKVLRETESWTEVIYFIYKNDVIYVDVFPDNNKYYFDNIKDGKTIFKIDYLWPREKSIFKINKDSFQGNYYKLTPIIK
ncbi:MULTISPECIES: hypothetical protein [unclassified Gilliamella]|uniref:hypothetical protein n=1 Tax=unclassified Gilliamella TaxID=2685620 RepID=UPI00130B6F35|nr:MULTISPECIES: hypothetical protein [unclassified Gilliamella]MWP48222.1 hypothetical protein [Gilliamella sp. Lep-s35]MWP68142.1 hypothetical protein [Gilliamella sp. Lep-s5]MWP76362.1 hypothetical protein [Gilliamella sp. Lep-s21]